MKLTIFIFIVLFHTFSNGSWIFGTRIGETAMAIDSEGQCAKYDGEERVCTLSDRAFMASMKNLYLK